MRNILLEIEYDGTDYSGWQYQPRKKTIQGIIETTLGQILQEPINLIGASRTDAGVSALGQVANFLTNSRISPPKIQSALNSLLPSAIWIKNAYGVHLLFHARFDAQDKVYRYQIIFNHSPLRQRFAWEMRYELNLAKMERAAKVFIGEKDYGPFCSIKKENGIVNLTDIKFVPEDGLIIIIEANRFLYKMARRIVGTLVDIGRDKINKNDIIKCLTNKSHIPLLVAPANGLILVSVKY